MSNLPELAHLDDSRLQSLADGTLRGPEGFEAREHCFGCAECGAALRTYELLSTQLSALLDPPVPTDFTSEVMQAVSVREQHLAQRRHTLLAAVPAAALAVFAIVGWALSTAPAVHVDRLLESATLLRHLFAALAPVFEAARLPLGLGAFALSSVLFFLLMRTLRPAPTSAAIES
jgi:anti-sigma factor RsiW